MEKDQIIEKVKKSFEDYKYAWIVGALILVVIVVALFVPITKNKVVEVRDEGCRPGFSYNINTGEPCPLEISSATPEGCKPGDMFSGLTGIPCSKEKVAEPKKPTTSTTTPSSLSEALVVYSGKTVKIGQECVITPNTQNQTKGTRIMVHNESSKAHAIMIGTQSFTLNPSRYKTLVLNTVGDIAIKCDTKAVGSIVVQ